MLRFCNLWSGNISSVPANNYHIYYTSSQLALARLERRDPEGIKGAAVISPHREAGSGVGGWVVVGSDPSWAIFSPRLILEMLILHFLHVEL